jgi:hypothetical protein
VNNNKELSTTLSTTKKNPTVIYLLSVGLCLSLSGWQDYLLCTFARDPGNGKLNEKNQITDDIL